MGTRCVINVQSFATGKPNPEPQGMVGEKVKIYRHWDGVPDVVIPNLRNALNKAWGTPRREHDEFAAAIVASMKDGPGNIRILSENQSNPGDIEYVYFVFPDPNSDYWKVQVFSADEGKPAGRIIAEKKLS